MAEQRLEALLGVHDPFLNRSLTRFLGRSHVVTSVATVEGIRQHLEMNNGDPATACRYAVVIMDVNLGYPNSSTIDAGREVYGYLRSLVDAGQLQFTTFSGNDVVVAKAEQEGIPCVTKPDGILAYIQKLQQPE